MIHVGSVLSVTYLEVVFLLCTYVMVVYFVLC